MEEAQTDKAVLDEVTRIVSRIDELVSRKRALGLPLYHLSQLGIDLGPDRLALEKLTGQRLGSFLQRKPDYKIERLGENHNVLSIVLDGSTADATASAKSRYKKSFWSAFMFPGPPGDRYLNLDTLRFGSTAREVETPGSEVRLIPARLRVDPEDPQKLDKVHQSIDAWLSEHQLPAERFLVAAKRSGHKSPLSELDALLALLDVEQLKRSSLPLDVVQLLSKSFRK